MSAKIITIGRQYGSGGRQVGQKLAKKLGMSFIDKELIAMAAKQSGIREDLLKELDEKATNSFLYSIVMGGGGLSGFLNGAQEMPMGDKVFLLQAKLIKDLAEQKPCVIVGRCADYILRDHKDVLSVFIHANMQERVQRAIKEYGDEKDKAEELVRKNDKRRASYYNCYADGKWGMAESYDLSLNSGIGLDACVEVICKYSDYIGGQA